MLTGYFKEFIIFMSFISIHEMGHIVCALFYRWNIEKIILLPFGGITIFHEKINRPLKEECIIALGGITFQTLFYVVLTFFIKDEMISLIHYSILLFNILPIYPLDGAKLFNIACNVIFSYKKSHIYTLFISIIALSLFIGFSYQNLLLVLVSLFLFIGILREWRSHTFLYHKFLLERYLYSFPFTKVKEIKGIHPEKMKRDHKHFFWIACKREKESQIVKELFVRQSLKK